MRPVYQSRTLSGVEGLFAKGWLVFPFDDDELQRWRSMTDAQRQAWCQRLGFEYRSSEDARSPKTA